jgi:sulfate permease, SulP family
VVILLLGGVVGYVAMPALAALLITVGVATVKPAQVYSVIKTGPLQTTVMAVTFALTVLIPLQYAVLTGVGLGIVLYVAQQSNRLTLRRLELAGDGRVRETPPPETIPSRTVVVLQPYGSLFFASAPLLRSQLPQVTTDTDTAVVILRLRGYDSLGLSVIAALRDYARDLHTAGSSMKLVISGGHVRRQLHVEGIIDLIGPGNIYVGNQWVGATLRRAYDDARAEVAADGGTPS